MTTITVEIKGGDPETRQVLEYLQALPFVTIKGEKRKKPQHVIDYEAALRPMTMEELYAKLERSEDDFRNGRIVTNEEMGQWIASLG